MEDIFISYSRADRHWAEAIAEVLQKEGYSVWWDNALPAGAQINGTIQSKLDKAKCILVLWSNNSVKSRWVLAEAEVGLTNDTLLPVEIGQAQVPVPFQSINAIRTVDFLNKEALPVFFDTLLNQLNDFLDLVDAKKVILEEKANADKVLSEGGVISDKTTENISESSQSWLSKLKKLFKSFKSEVNNIFRSGRPDITDPRTAIAIALLSALVIIKVILLPNLLPPKILVLSPEEIPVDKYSIAKFSVDIYNASDASIQPGNRAIPLKGDICFFASESVEFLIKAVGRDNKTTTRTLRIIVNGEPDIVVLKVPKVADCATGNLLP